MHIKHIFIQTQRERNGKEREGRGEREFVVRILLTLNNPIKILRD